MLERIDTSIELIPDTRGRKRNIMEGGGKRLIDRIVRDDFADR